MATDDDGGDDYDDGDDDDRWQWFELVAAKTKCFVTLLSYHFHFLKRPHFDKVAAVFSYPATLFQD